MAGNHIEMFIRDDRWVVRLVENGELYEQDFAFEKHAEAWAAGQMVRLGKTTETDQDHFGARDKTAG